MRELLVEYARLQRRAGYAPRAAPRSVRLACRPSGECRDCAAGGATRTLCGARCAFRVGGREYDTLHAAASALGAAGPDAPPRRAAPARDAAPVARAKKGKARAAQGGEEGGPGGSDGE